MKTGRMKLAIERIAKKTGKVDTVETRNSDSLDFYDMAIWTFVASLEEAYRAGYQAGINDAQFKT